MGRTARSSFTFSSRTVSAWKVDGASIADDRDELHHVVLHHVAQRAGLLVVATAALDADRLGHGDLHVVDVLPVPERLEDAVGEAEHQQVLHRLLAEVVIDAVDLLLDERRVQTLVERTRGGEVAAERLLDDHAHERPGWLRRETRLVEPVRERHHRVRWRAEVEEAVAAGAVVAVRRVERAAQAVESVGSIHVVRDVAQARGEAVPCAALSGTRPKRSAPSRMSARNSSSVIGRRPAPIDREPGGRLSSAASAYRAGTSLRLVRSPLAPKMTTQNGTGVRDSRRLFLERVVRGQDRCGRPR